MAVHGTLRKIATEDYYRGAGAGQELIHLWAHQLGNDRHAVPLLVSRIVGNCSAVLDTRQQSNLGLALSELLFNAIEHGSLAIGSAEKWDALEQGSFEQLIAQRASQMPFRRRIVRVVVGLSERRLVCRITDQGRGFAWKELLRPPPTITSATGCGIAIARWAVDDLRYNPVGNQVTLMVRAPNI